MKIVCLIQKLPPTIYFVNTIHRSHSVALVIEEKPRKKNEDPFHRLIAFNRSYGFYETLGTVFRQFSSRLVKQSHDEIHNQLFQKTWYDIQPDIPVLQVEDINAPSVLKRLQQEKPDIILDHGTSIVRNHILETADWALNLHWGLSPYYRGTHCTEWALINWDPYNIGVTIHKLARNIDGGDIIAQKHAEITDKDSAYSIDMQLSYLGTDLICKILDRLKAHGALHVTRQNIPIGYLTLDRQWSQFHRRQIQYIERNRIIREMLRNPSRRERFPIIELT